MYPSRMCKSKYHAPWQSPEHCQPCLCVQMGNPFHSCKITLFFYSSALLITSPLLLQQVPSPLTSVPRNDEVSFAAITQFVFSKPACSVCIKNTSIKSQQGVKGNRVSHLKANDVLPCEQELCILICRLLSHLYNFEPLFNEARLVPMMGNYIITMLMLKALYFTPSTCGCTARRKALMCQLGFRFWSRERLIQEMLLCLPCSQVQQGLGSWWAVGVPVVWGCSVLQPAAGD